MIKNLFAFKAFRTPKAVRMRRFRRGRRHGGRLVDLVAALGAILLLALIAARFQAATPAVEGRAQVVDGDSLVLSGRRLRLAGIDAPEITQTCRLGDAERACGREAKAVLLRLVGENPISCSIVGRDRYGRDLAECRAGDVDLNAAMVRAGHAVAFGNYESQEQLAQAERAGLWGMEFIRPAEWRRREGVAEEPVHAGLTGMRALLRRLAGM